MIAGAGYGGLAAYLALRHKVEDGQIQLTVVNADDRHLLLPELPLYLAGEERADEIRLHLRQALHPDVRLVIDKIKRIEPSAPAVTTSQGPMACDGLLLALGSVPNDFGVPGVKEHATTIGQWHDLTELRDKLLDQLRRKAGGAIAVIGGGFTGVEIASELAEQVRNKKAAVSVTLIAPAILPTMPPEMRQQAEDGLQVLGVHMVQGRAKVVTAKQVLLEGKDPVRADTIIWAAGVRANPIIEDSGIPVNHRGQAVADACLRIAPRVYGAGDCIAATDPKTGKPVAPTAQAALQAGPAAAANLMREIDGQPPQPFTVHDRGFLVSLGRRNAAGTALGRSVEGGDAATLKRMIELYHAYQIGGLQALGEHLKQAFHGSDTHAHQGT